MSSGEWFSEKTPSLLANLSQTPFNELQCMYLLQQTFLQHGTFQRNRQMLTWTSLSVWAPENPVKPLSETKLCSDSTLSEADKRRADTKCIRSQRRPRQPLKVAAFWGDLGCQTDGHHWNSNDNTKINLERPGQPLSSESWKMLTDFSRKI